ncbi:uncharacterized protein LOC142226304 isoform X2 [Haematobia irritans]|uniref:uncharacterized protein LOC142226304 isoform X2 n=1 Tax=Haematobia irritans TaxID=7368 RepID=UPI003F507658
MTCFSCSGKKSTKDEPYAPQTNNNRATLELTPLGIEQNNGEENQPLTHTEVKTKKRGNTVTVVRTTRTITSNTRTVGQNSASPFKSSIEIPIRGNDSQFKRISLNNDPEEAEPLTHSKVKKSKNGNTITIVKTTRSRVVNTRNVSTIVESTNQNEDSSVDQGPVYKTTTVVKTPKERKRFNLKSILLRRSKKEEKPPELDIEIWQKRCLLAHNHFRALHGVEPLTLNKHMCEYAMEWAQHLAKKNKLIHRKKNKYGENVALGTGSTYKVDDAVQMWYDEMENYDFKRPGLSSQTGHFSQVVWKGSSQLGVGVAQKNDSTWVVCNYDPPGNVIGIYDENVQRPLRRTPKSKPLSDLVKVPPKNEKAKDDDAKPSTSLGFMKTANKKGKWSAFELECLDAHNKRRALHGCSPMTLNRDLCSLANDWASHLAKIRTMHHRPKNEYGENLYQLTNRDPTGEDCVKAWYDEISLYRYKKPGFSMDTGHFTQVVWLDTTELGVGRAKVDNITFIVCNYNPPGNVMGQYKTQVPPLGGFKENPIKANKDCSKDNNNQIKPNANEHSNSKKSNFFSFLKTNKAK